VAVTDSPVRSRRERHRQGAGRRRHPSIVDSRQGPFIPVNCSAIPRDLLESEFFGHVRVPSRAPWLTRSVSSRRQRWPIFLDEIASCPRAAGEAPARIAEMSVRPVATKRTLDVRVIAATNRNLEQAMHSGTFRQDLFYRLKRDSDPSCRRSESGERTSRRW